MAKSSGPMLKLAALAARILPMPVKQVFYRLGPLSRLLRRTLNQSVPSGETITTVAGGGLAGLRLRLDLQIEKDFWLGTYEPDLQAAVGEMIHAGMRVYDVGANIGYVTLLLARAVGPEGRVVAFEALPENIARLRANLDLNPGLAPRVEVQPRAVTDCPGQVHFLVHSSIGMGKVEGSAGRHAQYSQTIEVPAVSLDAYVFEEGHPLPQAIKVDIEGGEVLALPGMRRVLQEAHPLLLMEIHGPEAAQVTWDILTDLGYGLFAMTPGLPPIHSPEELGWKAYLVARSNRG
jgi:FkbM family methyltransferase